MTAVDNILIRQTWIEEETEKVASELNEKIDMAFLMFGAATILDVSPSEIEAVDIVDGGQDKQIDYIHIEDDEDKGHASINIIQAKNSKGFSSNTVIQVRNGLDWIFERPKSEIEQLENAAFKEKINEIRSLRSDYGAANISVQVYHITNGDKSKLSHEYLQEAKVLSDKYGNLGFADFLLDQLGAHELVELMNAGDRAKRKVDIDIPIIYDTNTASLIEYSQGDTKSVVCTIQSSVLAQLASTEPRDSIFDMNIRPFYGSLGKVNQDIWATCTGEEASRFWFLNNGVTMVCEHFDVIRDPDAPKIKVRDAQIVNGCQTSVTIREAFEKGVLIEDAKVMLRLYSTDNPNLIEKITLTTNNQNKITDRDLRANDSVQRDIERLMEERYGYLYERKNKQHRSVQKFKKHLVVPSPKAAQSYLAIVRAKPSNARGYLGAIWSDFYSEIFSDASVADLLVAYLIHQICHKQALATRNLDGISITERDSRVYGSFHIARVIGYHLLKDCWGHSNEAQVEKLIKKLVNSTIAADTYDNALQIVKTIRSEDEKEHPIPALYFKNNLSQKKLNAHLYSE